MASQLELLEHNLNRQAKVLSKHLLKKQLKILSLRYILFQTADQFQVEQVSEAPQWNCSNIISMTLATLEEQHIASNAKNAHTNTARSVKIGASITNSFKSTRADIVATRELL